MCRPTFCLQRHRDKPRCIYVKRTSLTTCSKTGDRKEACVVLSGCHRRPVRAMAKVLFVSLNRNTGCWQQLLTVRLDAKVRLSLRSAENNAVALLCCPVSRLRGLQRYTCTWMMSSGTGTCSTATCRQMSLWFLTLHCESKKGRHYTLVHIFAKY